MMSKKLVYNMRSMVTILLCVCVLFSMIPSTASAASARTYVDGKVYELDKDNDYKFSEATSHESSSNTQTYGQFSISGTEASLVSSGKKDGVPAYTVSDGNITISYTYTDELLNAANEDWHLVEDKEKNVDIYELDNNIQKGALILQRSNDHRNWSNVSIQTNVFENTPNQNASLYETLDVELINGCYYRLIVVYKLSKLTDTSKVLWVFTDEDYEHKRVTEVYEFFAKVDNEHIEDLQSSTRKYRLGETSKVADFASYSGTEEITKKDIHYNWNLGDFFVSGFTSTVDQNGEMVFLKNVGDVVTLWFNLSQNIDALNNDPDLSITADPDGHDRYFQTDMTNFGRGMLIIRYTDFENVKHEPIMYYDFLEANTALGANTRVQLFEEGDYEVALDYEVTKDQLSDKVGHYRIFFKFKVRNANCMVYPFDVKTGAELTNSSVTPNGFYLDLARSRYLNIFIEKEVWTEGADGLTKDTRFNTTAKDGDKYTDEGIYTITVENQYTGLTTTKTIYVGTNRILTAYMTSNYSLAEIQDLVARGATIYEDGTIEMPPETYAVMHAFVSGTEGMTIPAAVFDAIPLNQANQENGSDVMPGVVELTEIKVEGGTWTFQGWDADQKVINSSDITFFGTWTFEADEEAEDDPAYTPESDQDSKLDENMPSGTEPNTEAPKVEQTEQTEEPIEKGNFGVIATVAIVVIAVGISAFVVIKKKSPKKEEQE